MSRKPDNIKAEIQDILVNINNITCKIKWELGIMKEILKKKGNLSLMVDEANKNLTTIIKNNGEVSIAALTNTPVANNDELDPFYSLNPIAIDAIAEELMSIVNT